MAGLDGRLEELEGELTEIDNLLADYNRDLAQYMADCEFDDADFAAVEERLNLLNRLKEKYHRGSHCLRRRETEASGQAVRL